MEIYEPNRSGHFPKAIAPASTNLRGIYSSSYPSTSQKLANDPLFYPEHNHAEVLLSYFTQAYKECSFTDIAVRSDGNVIRNAQRVVLAAFSTNFEAVLKGVENVVVNLEIDSEITGVSPEDLACVVDYMYNGQIKLRSGYSIINSLKVLGCHSIVPMLSRFENNVNRELIIEDADHANSFALALQKFNVEGKFHDCTLKFRDTSIHCHRLSSDSCESVTIDPNSIVDSKIGISSQDMRIIIEFMYTGRLCAMKKRFVSLRESCRALKVDSLYHLLSTQLEASTCSLKTRQDKIVVDTLQCHPTPNSMDRKESSITDVANPTDYSAVYNAFVEGPARGKKLFCKTLQKRRRMAGKSSLDQDRIIFTNSSISFNDEKVGSQSEGRFVYLDGVVDNDDIILESVDTSAERSHEEKPFKCPFCEHRTKEKSAVEKHIRCIHTQEALTDANFVSRPSKFKAIFNVISGLTLASSLIYAKNVV
uniref:BTB domain-containing protein n=1 Tax=Ditylenchus dipsaci TaxID=166011 RepID=A0A915E8B2_9BILA